MKVLLVNQYFHPEVAAVAQHMADLAQDLSRAGFTVGVLCGRGQYADVQNSDEPGQLTGIRVWRLRYCHGRATSTTVRLLSYVTFILSAAVRSLFLPKFDVVLVFSSPPLVGTIAWIYAGLRRAHVVSVVEDFYPDVAVALGFLPSRGLLVRMLYGASNFLLRRSRRIITLSDQMKNRLIERGMNESQIVVIHNWADGERIRPTSRDENSFLDRHDLHEKFVVQYSGHMGEAHVFDSLLAATRQLSDLSDVGFLFIGDGPKRQDIAEFIDENSLRNVLLLPYQQRAFLVESLGAASVSVISLRPEVSGLIVPSKLYGALAAGKPVVFIGSMESEVARTVVEGECGFVVEPQDTDSLVDVILRLRASPSLVREMGEKARAFFEANYDRELQTGKYISLFREIQDGDVG